METLTKPLLRGHFHQSAFFAALGASMVLLCFCPNSKTFLAALVYCASLTTLYGVSALYHRPNWGAKMRMWMRRIDHAAIYVLIAGTGTPVCLLGSNIGSGNELLTVLWIAAVAGMVQTLFWVNAPKWVSVIFYVSMACLALPYLKDIGQGIGLSNLMLVLVGCFFQLVGAVVYARKKPNPHPQVFGYHEIFHLLVVVGSVFHFLLVIRLVQMETL